MIAVEEDILVEATKRYSAIFGVALAAALAGSALIAHFNTVSSPSQITTPVVSVIKDSNTGHCYSYNGDNGIAAVFSPTLCNSSAIALTPALPAP